MYVTHTHVNPIRSLLHTHTCSQTLSHTFTPADLLLLSLSGCKSLHNLQSTWKSKFFLLWSNYHAAWTLEWIFKSNTLILTRTCPLWCSAEGYMWYTKPSLSASSTRPGWKADREDAELHALSIHYPVIVMLQQLLEQKAAKTSCNVCKHYRSQFIMSEAYWWKTFRFFRFYFYGSLNDLLPTLRKDISLTKMILWNFFSAFRTSYVCKWLPI